MSEIRILGIWVSNKEQTVQEIQETLTKYGCNIRTRLGLNDLERKDFKDGALIILELMGDIEENLRLENDLWAIPGLKIQKMIF